MRRFVDVLGHLLFLVTAGTVLNRLTVLNLRGDAVVRLRVCVCVQHVWRGDAVADTARGDATSRHSAAQSQRLGQDPPLHRRRTRQRRLLVRHTHAALPTYVVAFSSLNSVASLLISRGDDGEISFLFQRLSVLIQR